MDSQEIFSERPDVLTYRTGVLDRPLTISGLPVALNGQVVALAAVFSISQSQNAGQESKP